MGKVKIRYNKHTKLWEAWNEHQRPLAADSSKDRVMLFALKQDHPELHAIIRSICIACSADGNGHGVSQRLFDTLIKAAQIVAKGGLYSDGVCRSSDDNGYYVISYEGIPKHWKCNCKAFQMQHLTCDYGVMCKHTFALMIAHFLQIELPQYYKGMPVMPDNTPEEDIIDIDLNYYNAQLDYAM